MLDTNNESTPKFILNTSSLLTDDISNTTDDDLLKDSYEPPIPIIVEDNSSYLPLADIDQNQILTNATNHNINGMFRKF